MASRKERSLSNMRYGMIYQIMYLVCNFLIRISMIKFLGITALSLNGLFVEILSILSLAEMGVGTAITYSLYKPLAEKDEKHIAQLMNLFKRAYWLISAVMFALGICMIPFLPYLVKAIDVDLWYLRLVYFLFLAQTCASYVFSYKALLLVADQRADVQAKINIVVRLLFFALSFVMIAIFKNFIAYLFSEIGYAFFFYYYVGKVVDKMYPYIVHSKEELPKEEKKQIFFSVKQVFVGKLSNRVLNSTDNILISTLVGTTLVGVYSQYSMFTNGFLRLFSQINEAVVGSIGNLLAVESKKHAKETYDNLTYIFFLLGSICSTCLFVCINPFLQSIIGKDYLLPDTVLLLITIILFVETLKMPLWTFFNAAGLFKAEQYISLIGCILNIVVSIILGLKTGMVGIFIGTLVSLGLMIILKLFVLGNRCFDHAHADILFHYAIYSLTFLAELFLSTKACSMVATMVHSGISQFLINGVIGLAISFVLSYVLYISTNENNYLSRFVKTKLNRKKVVKTAEEVA